MEGASSSYEAHVAGTRHGTVRSSPKLTCFPQPGIKAKVENKGQYDEYLRDLKPIRDELGVNLKEDLYPDPLYSGSVDAQAS